MNHDVWERVHERLDRCEDPLADEVVQVALADDPEAAGEVARMLERLEALAHDAGPGEPVERPARAHRRRVATGLAAIAAGLALWIGLGDHDSATDDRAPAPDDVPPIAHARPESGAEALDPARAGEPSSSEASLASASAVARSRVLSARLSIVHSRSGRSPREVVHVQRAEPASAPHSRIEHRTSDPTGTFVAIVQR